MGMHGKKGGLKIGMGRMREGGIIYERQKKKICRY